MSVKAIAVNPDQPSVFIEITQPMPQPGEHDLLVEVKAVSVNPVDTKVHAGLSKNGLQAPRILGWDASGIVKAVGAGVTQFQAGDEVWYAGDITRPGSNTTHQLIDARIVGHKPQSLDWAAAAALPLTALTAWEGLFERLNIQDAGSDKTLLIIGGAGGVGSLAVPFAKHNSQIKVIATASREDSAQWCRDRGADLVVNYRDLKGELAKHDIKFVDYIFILNDTDGHWDAVCELIAPQGHICTIVENDRPLDQSKLKSKSAALHWEFMYTRSMYQTADMARQGEILNEVAKLVDAGVVESSLSETLHGLSMESITEAHRKVLDGHMRGKVVVAF
ncbi:MULTISPECIES: zinc-binding alcohol dehydrogenase family protein [Lelliottia]|uniref:Zinc-type alcohol dehydrogenase-like protein n=1 Tax=Lelliottia aquatilis TaxID=2080838 RepID=A0ABX5A3T5_9ENTR|nr:MULTISPECIES: zinc-binding alcohol dehydrogenase family protein [Lelliottia]NTZ46590.1 zinc-binding alcohol dehydrogenase family protein [Lelliottia aquatilis]POZ23495.1 zinc-binding alcohol dehydrogenase family protein [Lelliottia aquatilis]POZ27062.1 zinc-binding alcohol dehydrogenase family protein [Lelliottia sp. 7254-16]POZ28114.1 zinc-binding alcohol dehydrogenase family protein [Lelliottia aquatilis]POZ32833.1 zinc-binding alcohol dehydrogenase family protein [Lelliottia aquatilis]